MAIKVPTLSNSGTQQQALPGVRQQGGRSAAEFMDTTEMSMLDSASKAVNSMQRASMSLYAKEVADANKLRVQDATNQLTAYDQDAAFSETGWRNQKGAAVFSQQNSKPLPDNVLEARQQQVETLMKTLGNDDQRQAFQAYVNQSGLQLRGHLMGHEAEQHRVYKRGVLASGIDTATRNMTLFYNDENQLKSAIDSIEQASKDLGYLEHGSEEIGVSNGRQHVSKALNQAIEASITQGDHASATRILQQFSPHMDSNDMLKAYKLITDEQEKRTALNIGQEVIGELYPMMDTGDGDRAFNILLGTESGGNHYQGKFYGLRPDGTPKGTGYLGELKRPDGGIMTEFSVGVEINGKEMDIPTIVPTLSKDEINFLLNMKDGDKLPDGIVQKAVDHANNRIKQGLSVWHDTPKPITSPKGAVGIAQVMPDTAPEAAKLAGLDWDENKYRNDPDYNKALGKAYFQKQLADFGGDLPKAYAAYNAGPGATKNALKQAEATGQPWTSFLPAETQAYINKNMKAYGAGQGQNPRPTLVEAQQMALAKLGDNASSTLQKQTLDIVEKHYNDQTKAIKQRNEESTAQAMRYVLENGGKWSDLPATVRGSVPVDDVEKVMNFAKKVSAGDPVETDWALFYRFKTDEKLLKDTNLMAFRDKLNDSEFKNLTEEQQKLNTEDEQTFTKVRSAQEILNGFMIQAGIDPKPADDDKKGSATVGKILNAYETKVREAEQDKGKKLNSEELQKVAAQLFTQVGVKGLLYGTNEKPKVLLDETDKIKVPDSERQAIIDAWKVARPDRSITEDDIMTMYARNKGLL